jgi:Flp pilus assembly protein TadG
MPHKGEKLASNRLRRKRERGYILVAFTLAAAFLIGMTGLAIDIGRMYIAKNEAQSFVDSMALTAAAKLNGDQSGVFAAAAAVSGGVSTKLWNLGTTPFSADATTVEFSSSDAPGAWTDAAGVPVNAYVAGGPKNPVSTDRVRVSTTVQVPLTLLRAIVPKTAQGITASATAVRSGASEYGPNTNVVPLSPTSHKAINTQIDDPDDPFGFRVGQYYTLRWEKQGSGKTTSCAGDGAQVIKYFQDYKGENWLDPVCQGASTCKTALERDGLDYTIAAGPNFEIDTKEGNASSIVHASDARVGDDTDSTSTSYFGDNGYLAKHLGNGRRIVYAPVNDGTVTGSGSNSYSRLVGFGAFLLMPAVNKNQGPICGQYLGTAIPGQPFSGGVAPGSNPTAGNIVMALRLVR